MKRPQIINFFKKGTTLAYVHEVYKMNPELWAYIQAFDAAYDDMESQLQERELKINRDDPYNHVLINKNGDTYTFNPLSRSGEELDSFLYGYFDEQVCVELHKTSLKIEENKNEFLQSQLEEREKDHTKDKARLLVEKAKVENCRKQRDELQSQLKERDQICEKIISTMDHEDFWDNIQKLEDLMKRKPN